LIEDLDEAHEDPWSSRPHPDLPVESSSEALNPVIDARRRNGKIEFIHVPHEEYGVLPLL
jgi:hypothetical protein